MNIGARHAAGAPLTGREPPLRAAAQGSPGALEKVRLAGGNLASHRMRQRRRAAPAINSRATRPSTCTHARARARIHVTARRKLRRYTGRRPADAFGPTGEHDHTAGLADALTSARPFPTTGLAGSMARPARHPCAGAHAPLLSNNPLQNPSRAPLRPAAAHAGPAHRRTRPRVPRSLPTVRAVPSSPRAGGRWSAPRVPPVPRPAWGALS